MPIDIHLLEDIILQKPGQPMTAGRCAKIIIATFVGLFGISMALTALHFVSLAVMSLGGMCASGGPYEIATPCPQGFEWLLPIIVFGAMASCLLYAWVVSTKRVPNLAILFWFACFGILGGDFLKMGLFNGRTEISFLICGIMFELMAFPALWLADYTGMAWLVTGKTDNLQLSQTPTSYRPILLLAHLASVGGGIWFGWHLYRLTLT